MTKKDRFFRLFLPWLGMLLCVPTPNLLADEGRQGLLIIAPEPLLPALSDFARFKKTQRPVEVCGLASLLAESSGCDDPERVKRAIHKRYQSSPLGFVLLVGDADVFPVRYMVLDRATEPAFHYAFYPSDLYYGDLVKKDGSFEDWNGRSDDFHGRYFGEVRGEFNKKDPINFDAIDYRPEIAVGRWPASTVDEVRAIAEKTMRFERNTLEGRSSRTAGFFVVDGWVDTRAVVDRAITPMSKKYALERRFFAREGDSYTTVQPSRTEFETLLNQGSWLIAHTGHGSDHVWEGVFGSDRIDHFKNEENPSILLSIGCSTARFATLPPYEAYTDELNQDHLGTNGGEVFLAPPPPPAVYQKGHHNPTGLGEQLLRRGPKGAVAYIGCNTGSQPCALTLLVGFTKRVARPESTTLGEAWMAAIDFYVDAENLEKIQPTEDWYPASLFFQGMKFMLFGDPSLRIPGAIAGF